jgi:nucleotide-binding universal stress UspA family protein
MTMVSKILVPVDFSSSSKPAVECAVALATALRCAVTLFHVCQLPDLMSGIVPGADNTFDADRDRAIAQSSLESLRTDNSETTATAVSALVARTHPTTH